MVKVGIGSKNSKKFSYELNTLMQHAAIVGASGSGKTVMCKVLIEEALSKNIPVIAIDPKGDIGGLAIANKTFDFRPFGKLTQRSASKIAQTYNEHHESTPEALLKTKTTIYTPKATAGQQLALMPDLKAPYRFKQQTQQNPSIVVDFVEPISTSLCSLAGIRGALQDKVQALISEVLIEFWSKNKDLTLTELIKQIQNPPFETIGSLALDEFINEKERQKAAAQLNILLSSPAKKAWREGQAINIAGMLKPSNLSIVDLRFTGTNDEKQFAVQQILQELYRHLIRAGGSTRLKYILYIDELAGLLPPPPAQPPCKKLLELLIRQARAFGLGIVLATQSPGDVDYKLLGNLGTRFIGKLRTEQDMDKMATATGTSLATLKEHIAQLKTGQFVFNDAVHNKTDIIQSRWLYTYHGGPLQQKEIAWINKTEKTPKITDKLITTKKKQPAKNSTAKRVVKKKKLVSAQQILNDVKVPKKKSKKAAPKKKLLKSETNKTLTTLVGTIKRYADKTNIKIATTPATYYTPHLKIVVETKPYKKQQFELQGPFYFDLTAKMIPLGKYLNNVTWRTLTTKDFEVDKPKRSVTAAFDYAIREAQHDLSATFYEKHYKQGNFKVTR